jgi:hypothetical protein
MESAADSKGRHRADQILTATARAADLTAQLQAYVRGDRDPTQVTPPAAS